MKVHFILAALVVMAVAGCGKKAEPTPPTTGAAAPDKGAAAGVPAAAAVTASAPEAPEPEGKVTLWHSYRDAERAGLDELVGHWNKNHDKLKIETLAVPADALIDKFQVAVPNGNGPDLIIFAHDKIGVWAKDGLIAPLGESVTPAKLKRFLPQTVKPLVFDKAIFGLPLAYKTLVLFYNKKLVREPPKTLNQLIEVAKGFTKPDSEAFGLAYEAANLYFHAPFLLGAGGGIFDDSGRIPKLDTPQAAKGLSIARDLYKTHKILPQASVSGFVITSMFNDGKVPFVLQGPWFMGEIDKGVEFGVALLPELEAGVPLRPFLGSEALMLSKKTTNAPAALRIIDYLTSDEAAITRLQTGKQMVANIKPYELPKFGDDPFIKIFRAQAELAVPMPAAAEMAAIWNPYNTALQKVIYGDTTPEEALAEAQKRAAEDIVKMQK